MTQTIATNKNSAIAEGGSIPIFGCVPSLVNLSQFSFGERSRGINTCEELDDFFVRHLNEIVRRTLPAVGYSEERAREVVQELYLRLIRLIGDGQRGIREPWGAIRVLTRNLVIDMHRERERHHRLARNAVEMWRSRENRGDMEQEGEQRRVSTLIDATLDVLDNRKARIIEDIYLFGKAAKEVATHMRLSESRLAELRRDALNEMRRLMMGSLKASVDDCPTISALIGD